jgi:hypothetical protein
MALQIRYDLSPSLANILLLLAQNKVVTAKMVEVDHKLTKDTKVAIHRLRRRLEGAAVEIKSRRDVGYWVDDKTRADIREAMKPDQLELPFQELPHGGGGNSA